MTDSTKEAQELMPKDIVWLAQADLSASNAYITTYQTMQHGPLLSPRCASPKGFCLHHNAALL